MEDLKRIQRLVNILRHIDSGRARRLELSREFGVSERQIYRDVNDLNYSGFPIIYDRYAGSYRFQEGYSLKKIAISMEELQGVLIAREMFKRIGGHLSKSMDNLMVRLLNGSAPSAQDLFLDIQTDPPIDFSMIESQYNSLIHAIKEKHRVEIEHMGSDGVYINREIDPYKLFYSEGFWYVLAYCHMRDDIRTFALDRIKNVFFKDTYFAIKGKFNFEKYMSQCWRNYSLGEPEEVKICFSPNAAKLIKRKKWHPTQTIKENNDGSLEFMVTVSGTDEIMRWILTWGHEAKVLHPKYLIHRIKDEVNKLAKIYR